MTDLKADGLEDTNQGENLKISLNTMVNNVCVQSNMSDSIQMSNKTTSKGKKPKVKLVPVLIPVMDYSDSDSNDTHEETQITIPNVGSVTVKTPKNVQDLSSFTLLEDSEFNTITPLQESSGHKPNQSNSSKIAYGKSKSNVTLPSSSSRTSSNCFRSTVNTNSATSSTQSQSNSIHIVNKDGSTKSKINLPPGVVYSSMASGPGGLKTYSRSHKANPNSTAGVSGTSNNPNSFHTLDSNKLSKLDVTLPDLAIPDEPKTLSMPSTRRMRKTLPNPNALPAKTVEDLETQCESVNQEENSRSDDSSIKITSLLSGEVEVDAAHMGLYSKIGSDLTVKPTRSYSRKNPVVGKVLDSSSGEVIGLSTSSLALSLPKSTGFSDAFNPYKDLNASNAHEVNLEEYRKYLTSELDAFSVKVVYDIARLNLTMKLNKFKRGEIKYLHYQTLGVGDIKCPLCKESFQYKAVLRTHVMNHHRIETVYQFPKYMRLLAQSNGRKDYSTSELKQQRNILDEVLNYKRWINYKKPKNAKSALTTQDQNDCAGTSNKNELLKPKGPRKSTAPKSNVKKKVSVATKSISTDDATSIPISAANIECTQSNLAPEMTPQMVVISANEQPTNSEKDVVSVVPDVVKTSLNAKTPVGNDSKNVTPSLMSTTKSTTLLTCCPKANIASHDETTVIPNETKKTRKEIPSEKYYCHWCNFKSNEISEFFEHRLEHMPQLQCPLCQIFVTGRLIFLTHLRSIHDSEGTFDDDQNLKIKNLKNPEAESLIIPKSDYQPPDDKVIIEYHCQACGFYSLQYDVYMEHVKSDHIKTCQCKICHEEFNNELIMIEHMKRCEIQQILDRRRELGPFTCVHCNKEFEKKNAIMLHLRMHNVNRYFCVFCKEGFLIKRLLKSHYAEEHEFGCRKCKVQFSNVRDLYNHRFTHEKKHSLVCEFCQKTFSNKPYYNDHVNAHKGIKTHTCKFCGEKFSYYMALEMHRHSVHFDEFKERFLCNHCGVQFRIHRMLYSHIRNVHEGKKPPTKYGPMKDPFYRKRIRTHTRSRPNIRRKELQKRAPYRVRDPVTGELVPRELVPKNTLKRKKRLLKPTTNDCEICGIGFSLANDLWSHKDSHKRYSEYQCDFCRFYFVSQTSLNTHIEMEYCEQFKDDVYDVTEDPEQDYVPPKKRHRAKSSNASSKPSTSTFDDGISLVIGTNVDGQVVTCTDSEGAIYVSNEVQVQSSSTAAGAGYIIVTEDDPNYSYYQEFL